MPSWKKVVVSGSDASLNSLNVTNTVTASFFTGSFTGDGSGLLNLPIDTSSLVTTSSFNDFTSSYNTGSFTGSFTGDGSGLENLPERISFKQNIGLVSGSININLNSGSLIDLELQDNVELSFSNTPTSTNSFVDFTLRVRDLNQFSLNFQELDILPQQEISTSNTERSLILGKYLGNNQTLYMQLINLRDFNEYVDGDYVENYFV